MNSTRYLYNENAKETGISVLISYIYTIEVDCHSSCDICKIRFASIFQERELTV